MKISRILKEKTEQKIKKEITTLKLNIMFGLFKKKEVKNPKEEEWVTIHLSKAKVYAETHKAGTRVAAESKDGTWKEGKIIGEHDWELFTFFFTVKFDDGEIIKQKERKVTKL